MAELKSRDPLNQQPDRRASASDPALTGPLPESVIDGAEIEAKFLIGDPGEADAILRALAGFCQLSADRTETVTDQYLDTPDLDLHDAGYGCRIRCRAEGPTPATSESPRWRLECKALDRGPTLGKVAGKAGGKAGGKTGGKAAGKAAGNAAGNAVGNAVGNAAVKVRREVEQPLPGPVSADQLPPEGPVVEMLRSMLPRAPVPLLRFVNQRRRYRANYGNAVFDVALDSVEVMAGPGHRPARFDELEIELVEGSQEQLEGLIRSLDMTVSLRPSRLGKLDRGLWLINPERSSAPSIAADQPASLLLQSQLRHDLRVIEQSVGVALEGLDPEGIHRLRTHVRRARATLAAASEWLGPQAKSFSNRFKSLADAVGNLRDHDVFAAATAGLLQTLPDVRERTAQQLRVMLDAEHRRLRDSASAVLSDDGVAGLFASFRQRILVVGDAQVPTVAGLAARELARRARNVRKGIEDLAGDAPDAVLHELRIRVKKLRYVLELFAPVLGRRIEPLSDVLRGLQDVLGAHQDARVAVVRIQQLAGTLPMLRQNRDALLTLGRLQREREIEAARISRGLLARKGRKALAKQLRNALRQL